MADSWPLRRSAQQEEAPRARLQVVGKVLADHQWLEHDHGGVPHDGPGRVRNHCGDRGVVDDRRSSGLEVELTVAAHGGRDPLSELSYSSQQAGSQLRIQAPQGALDDHLVRHDVGRRTAVGCCPG